MEKREKSWRKGIRYGKRKGKTSPFHLEKKGG